MAKFSYLTKEGLEKLKEELRHLKTEGRRDMARQISEARDKGDLSENAEYDAAKEAQGLMEMKISQLEDKVANARIIEDNMIKDDQVSMLHTVEIKNLKNGMTMKYTLVPEEEADVKKNRISIISPIAKGLMGKKVGEIAEVQVPAGKMQFEVLSLALEN